MFKYRNIKELNQIYEYISSSLKQNNSAIKIIKEINKIIIRVFSNPNLHSKINKGDRLRREYHKIVVKRYIVLYSVNFNKKKVYVSRIIMEK